MKFSSVVALAGSVDALTLNQMAEIYKQVYQRPSNDLLTMVEEGNATANNSTAAGKGFAENATNNTTAPKSFAQNATNNTTAAGAGFAENATNNPTAAKPAFAEN